MAEAIRCEGLTRTFGPIVAVDHLDLSVEENSIFGFLGPNGAGKSTTIKMLVGLIEPTAGKAIVAGVDARDHSIRSRHRLGYLPENPNFYGWMSGEELLLFVGRLFGVRGAELRDRVDVLLKEVGLHEAGKRKISGYSRGMKQRLGMAQALINNPSVLLLDEPCSALDPIGRMEVLNMIRRLGRETTVFMSTHILADVDRICDSVAIINRGRLVAQSGIEELRRRYALPVFRIAFETKPTRFREALEGQGWVERVDEEGPSSFMVRVSDLDKAKDLLPKIAAADDARLVRYELSSPTLEEIFVRMVG